MLTLLAYAVTWGLGLTFPDVIVGVPTFVAIFVGFYSVLYVVMLVAWGRK